MIGCLGRFFGMYLLFAVQMPVCLRESPSAIFKKPTAPITCL